MLTGKLWYHFIIAILLTAVVSRIVLAWYRRAVNRSMQVAGSAPTEASWLEPAEAAWRPGGLMTPQDPKKGAVAEAWLYRRIALVYGLGGLAASAVLTTMSLISLGDRVRPLPTFVTFYIYCWPIVPVGVPSLEKFPKLRLFPQE